MGSGSREMIDEAFDVLSTAVLRACDLTFDALTPRDFISPADSGPLSGPHSCPNHPDRRAMDLARQHDQAVGE
jgi:hypothetical protein